MKIIGNTVGTTLPKPDLMQTDPKKGDYVKGKDEFRAIPTFDLNEIGVPDIPLGGEVTVENIDAAELLNALKDGLVKIRFRMNDGVSEFHSEIIVSGFYSPDLDACSVNVSFCFYDASRADPIIMCQGVLVVGANYITTANRELQKALPEWNGGSY